MLFLNFLGHKWQVTIVDVEVLLFSTVILGRILYDGSEGISKASDSYLGSFYDLEIKIVIHTSLPLKLSILP